jgi:hypothetical protein
MMVMINNSKINAIIPNQPKATWLTLRRHNKSIFIIEMIFNSIFSDASSYSFWEEAYMWLDRVE